MEIVWNCTVATDEQCVGCHHGCSLKWLKWCHIWYMYFLRQTDRLQQVELKPCSEVFVRGCGGVI